MSDYKKELYYQYEWYLNTINDHFKSKRSFPLPIDAFYFGLDRGTIQQNTNDVKWLEDSIDKLQGTLSSIENMLEREKFKQMKGVDLAEKLKRV